MDCIICGSWFASTIHDGACPTCSRAIKQLRLNITPDRLLELVQAEKDGRLVMLPCKVGDYVFIDGRKAIVEEFFGYKLERYLQAQFFDNMQYIDIPFDEIGKTVFLTRKEAEAALEKREEDYEAD